MLTAKEFIESLNDTELSFLYVYKYKTSHLEAQRTIDYELAKRGLDKTRITSIIDSVLFNPQNTGCPRCNSQKFLNSNRCAICNYSIGIRETKKKSWLRIIWERLTGSSYLKSK